MAEVVGAISGAITIGALATNVAMSVAKLKSYWDLLEDAPEDIRRLIEEIEILSLILDDVKDDQAHNPVSSLLLDGTSLSRCLEHCKRAADRLRQLTDDMGNSIDTSHQLKRKWASAKVLLKKDKIEKFKLELEGAIRLLSLSHQSYTRALLRLQPDIIFARVSQAMRPGSASNFIKPENHQQNPSLLAPPSRALTPRRYKSSNISHRSFWHFESPFNAFGNITCCTKQYSKNDHEEMKDSSTVERYQEITAWYRGPAWLVNRAWAFHAINAFNGWDFRIRQYNVIPRNSLIFEYTHNGNILGLQELFDRRQASPLDCDEYGSTPLHGAANAGNYSVCKLLIERGADVNHRTIGSFTPTRAAIMNAAATCFPENAQEALETMCLLLSRAEMDPDDLKHYRGPEEGFILLQQHMNPQYYVKSLEELVEVAIGFTDFVPINGPELFRRALAQGDLPRLAVNIRNEHDETLFHSICRSIGRTAKELLREPCFEYRYMNSEKRRENLAGWLLCLKEVVQQGADLHTITYASHTPFIYLLNGVITKYDQGDTHSWDFVLNMWLNELMECGVDLYAYGQREQELHEKGLSTWLFRSWIWTNAVYVGYIASDWRLVSFTYGSSPSDWHVVVEQQVTEPDQTCEQMRAIPGGWVED